MIDFQNFKKDQLIEMLKASTSSLIDALVELGFTVFAKVSDLKNEQIGEIIENTTTDQINYLNENRKDDLAAFLSHVHFDTLIQAVTERRDEFTDTAAWCGDMLNEDDIRRLAEENDIAVFDDMVGNLDAADPIVRLAVEIAFSRNAFGPALAIEQLKRELRARSVYSEASLNQRELI